MTNYETKEHRSLTEKTNLGENLINLINQINELRDESINNDKIEGVFKNSGIIEKTLNEELSNELDSCDISALTMLQNEIKNTIEQEDKLCYDESTKKSLKTLYEILESIILSRQSKPDKNNAEPHSKTENLTEIETNDTNDVQKDEPILLDGIGGFYNKAFIFDKNIMQGNDKVGHYAIISGEKYYENKIGYNGKGYFSTKENFIMGEFKHGYLTGQGTDFSKEGTKYEGTFLNRKREGEGIYTFQNGTKIMGNFHDGYIQSGRATIDNKGEKETHEIKRDFKGIKIISEGTNKGKYIDEKTGEITDIPLIIRNLTEIQIQNIKYIQQLGIEINPDNIEEISKLEEDDLEILNTNSNNFYELYNYTKEEKESHQHYKKGRIIESIQKYVQNVISEKRDIGKFEIINSIRSDLVTLPTKEKIDIIIGIQKIVTKFNTVRKYLNFENGLYNSPKELLCAIRGITDSNVISKITENITVKQYGTGLMFFVGDEKSYEIIVNKSLKKSKIKSGGFNNAYSEVEGLEGTLSVKNGKETKENKTIIHEGQHNWNTYFMPDKSIGLIAKAKDEITAYLRDGHQIFAKKAISIQQLLTEKKLYQYNLSGDELENHKKQVIELLKYADDLIKLTENNNTGLTRDNIISMLSCVPADQRKNLHQNIMNAVKTRTTKELLDKFRRSGTAEKQTEIDEISVANSIEDIKHILSDPKYSHISRVPNNKGGIEISAIIDEVAAGRLAIKYIPSEIRQYVQKYIKQ